MSSPATTLPRPASPWIFRPSIDLLVGCGAWSLPLLAITFYLSQRDAVALSFVFYFLGVFCNQPHYMATVYRAYRTPYDFNRYRFFTVYVTVFILLTVVVVHLAPALFPWLLTFRVEPALTRRHPHRPGLAQLTHPVLQGELSLS